MTPRRYLYRQDIARIVDVSVQQVKLNERHWGLLPSKQRINSRVVRYKAEPAMVALKAFFQDDKLGE